MRVPKATRPILQSYSNLPEMLELRYYSKFWHYVVTFSSVFSNFNKMRRLWVYESKVPEGWLKRTKNWKFVHFIWVWSKLAEDLFFRFRSIQGILNPFCWMGNHIQSGGRLSDTFVVPWIIQQTVEADYPIFAAFHRALLSPMHSTA